MNYITLTIIAIAGIALGIYFGRRSAKKSHDATTHDAPVSNSCEWANKEENCACGKKMEDCACANGKSCACGGAGGCGKGALDNARPFDVACGEQSRTTQGKQIEKKEESKQKILEFLETHDPSRPGSRQGIRNNDVEKLVGVSDATAERYLSELEREGMLTQHGDEGSGVFYTKK